MTRKTFIVFETALSAILAFIVFVMLLSVAHGQEQRTIVQTASPDWSELRCSRNADASIECTVCVGIDDGTKECSDSVQLKAPVNINRAQNLGDSLRARALRRWGIDGGQP